MNSKQNSKQNGQIFRFLEQVFEKNEICVHVTFYLFVFHIEMFEDFIKFVTHGRSAEAYIASMFTVIVVNVIVLFIILHHVFGFGIIVSILLAYLGALLIPIPKGLDAPYLAIDYMVRQIPIVTMIIYWLGQLLLMPYFWVISGGKQQGFYFIL